MRIFRKRSRIAAWVLISLACVASTATPAEPTVHYVSPSGAHHWPFTNWVEAATNIQAAVEAAESGGLVSVTNGTYSVSPQLVVTQDVTLVSVNGAASTTLDGMLANRVVVLASSNAVLDGFTITNGSLVHSNLFSDSSIGGGVLCELGTVRNCRISGNTVTTTQPGVLFADCGGFFCGPSGVVSNCLIEGNSAHDGGGGGGSYGLLVDCRIRSNSSAYAGGVVLIRGGIASNCSISGNRAELWGSAYVAEHGTLVNCIVVSNQAGGVAVDLGGKVMNCTVAGNSASNGVGLFCGAGGDVVNTIIYGNTPDNCVIGGGSFAYCDAMPPIPGIGNITNDPQFVNAGAGNYRLQSGSPCIDAGIGSNAPNSDLDGVPRPLDGDSNGAAAVDMGAYEFSAWEANTHYVSLVGGHQWPFTNWITAASSIQAAVDAATGGETVLVADGLYAPAVEITVTTNLTIRSANGASSTFVDGGLTTRCFRLLPAAACTIRGFTITNGFSTNDGGGIWAAPGSAIMDSVIIACTARTGGGVYAELSTITNCTFQGNSAGWGGGLFSIGGFINNCTFATNSALLGGGALQALAGWAPPIINCAFMGNTASSGGGLFSAALTNLASNANLWQMEDITNALGQVEFGMSVLTNMLSKLPPTTNGSMAPGGLSSPSLLTSTAKLGVSLFAVSTDLSVNSLFEAFGQRADDVPLTVENTVVSNCQFTGNASEFGGGLWIQDGGEVCDTVFVGNHSDSFGGAAIAVSAGVFRTCSFISNSTGIAGGGVMLAGGASPGVMTNTVRLAASPDGATVLKIEDSEFIGNSAGNTGGGLMLGGAGIAGRSVFNHNSAPWGGGIANWGGDVGDSTLASNNASFGGGLFALGGTVSGCTMRHNNAEWMGGGIMALSASASVAIMQCHLANNRAYAGGGVGLSESVQVEACRITDNTGERAGGGVFCIYGGRTCSSLISGNKAIDGGGIYCLAGGSLINATITANSAADAGGGLCVVTNATGGPPYPKAATILNTIIYGNTANNGMNFLNIGTNVSYSYSCTLPAPDPGGVGNITNAPQLTPTGRLKGASPCIDAGTASDAPPTDIDGEAPWDDPRHSNVVSIVDIGADEFVDTDLDSMADYWETGCFGSITNRNGVGDADNDALNDLAEYENSTSPCSADTDADQMPDGWEVSHALNPLADDADGDPDLDRMPNGSEYVCDTDPRNADSVLSLMGIRQQFGGVRLDWKGGSNAWQILECRDDLTCQTDEWLAIFALPPPTSLTNAIIDMGATNRNLFYRIRAER